MGRHAASVSRLAQEAGLDIDETLIVLWEAGFTELAGPRDLVARGQASKARRALGLASRREVSSAAFWEKVFKVDREGLHSILTRLAVLNPYDGVRLRHKAINRLRAEARELGLLRDSAPQRKAIPIESKRPPFEWTSVGHVADIKYLTCDQVTKIHFALVADFENTGDPLSPAGVRNNSLLESALSRPHTSHGGVLKYPTIEMAAGALLHSLVHNHPFHNGNKRTALVSTIVFLDENGLALTCEQDPLFRIVLQLAQHALVDGSGQDLVDRETHAMAVWIKAHSRWIEQGDRAIPWRRLRRILAGYGCEFDYPSGVGNRINIARAVTRTTRGFLFDRSQQVVLRTQSAYVDEGTDVQKNTIHKLRKDLELDDDNGIDSRAFYDRESISLGEFIVRYRKTLRRLAKL